MHLSAGLLSEVGRQVEVCQALGWGYLERGEDTCGGHGNGVGAVCLRTAERSIADPASQVAGRHKPSVEGCARLEGPWGGVG